MNGSFALVPRIVPPSRIFQEPKMIHIPSQPSSRDRPVHSHLTECAPRHAGFSSSSLISRSLRPSLKDATQVTRRSSSLRSPPSKPFFPASQPITQALPSLTARCPPACFILHVKLRHHHILAFNFIPAPCPNLSYTVAYFCNSFELSFLKLLCSIQSPPRRLFPVLSR